VSNKEMVILVECCKKSCGHILTEDEYAWMPDPRWKDSRTAECPMCGGESFYTLKENGQHRMSRDTAPREIHVMKIEPSTKMGPKRWAKILMAKKRAMDRIEIPKPIFTS